MVRCQKFYDIMKRLLDEGDEKKLRDFCDKSGVTIFQIEKHIEFMEKNILSDPSLTKVNVCVSSIPEFATRPIRSQPEKVQKKVISKIKKALKKGEKVKTPQVKKWIIEASPKPKKKAKAKKERMYKDTETWNPFQGCEFDCIYCINGYRESLQRLSCATCRAYRPYKHKDRLKGIPSKRIIFVLGDSDPYYAIKYEPEFFEQILEAMRNDKRKDRIFFLQSKAPACLEDYLHLLPKNTYLLTTLETNRDEGYDKISEAPKPSKRYKDFLSLKWDKKIVTVEPIMDFDLDSFSKMLVSIDPKAMFIGYESHGSVKLETPSFHKTLDLMCVIRHAGIKVCPKHIPKVAYREFKP